MEETGDYDDFLDAEHSEFSSVWAQCRPDKQPIIRILDDTGRVRDQFACDGPFRNFTSEDRERLFQIGSATLSVETSSPYCVPGILTVDHTARTLHWAKHINYTSADWDEIVDRSRCFVNQLETYYDATSWFCHAVRRNENVGTVGELLTVCVEEEHLTSCWVASIVAGAGPRLESLLYELPTSDFKKEISDLPPKLRDWVGLLHGWLGVGDHGPAHRFESLICDADSDPELVAFDFLSCKDKYIVSLEFLVTCRHVFKAFMTLTDGEPEKVATVVTLDIPERRYRRVEVAKLLHVSRQAVTNWKARAPSHYPAQSLASATEWRRFVASAWPDGQYSPDDIPLH